MATKILSVSELLEIYISEIRANSDELTDFNEGSIQDIEAGATSTGIHETMSLIVDQFKKTFFGSADGPEVTFGADDLQFLAVDHYGEKFKRPLAQKAIGIVTFTRPNTAAGNVNILAGTVVKTQIDSGGNSQRYATIADVTMIGTSINASIEALVAGINGNVDAAEIDTIESSLTDSSVVVSNLLATSGGAAKMNDADYRQYIRDLIESIKGATIAAIEAAARTVSGVVLANVVEIEKVVIQWDIGTSSPIGTYFRIPYVTLYIADANGTANAALVAAVKAAIEPIRAAGVRVLVSAATAFGLNWTGAITLDSGGPNFSTLSADPDAIIQTMRDYIANLPTGTGFVVANANAAMLAIWGPAGTGDLVTGGFTTVTPSGDVAGSAGIKLIPGTVAIGSC